MVTMMIKIKFVSYWCTDNNHLRYLYNKLTPNQDYVWKDLFITSDGDYDFVVVQGSTNIVDFDLKKCVLIQNESKYFRDRYYKGNFLNPDSKDFYFVYDIEKYRALDHWGCNYGYGEFLNSENFKKSDIISSIFSSSIRKGLEYEKRIIFMMFYLNYLDGYSHYGRNNGLFNYIKSYKGELSDSSDALCSYKYHFVSENSIEKNYYTEKIIRAILSECLVFYYGCPNISEFIDSKCYIPININDPEESIYIIKSSIKNQEWEKNIKYIREEKYRLLNEDNPMEILYKIINGKI